MWLQGLLFVLGLAILYYGAEWLVKGASSLALRFGIRPLVVGLTVVALGTSMPEFVVNFFAALSGEDNLALGNIVGSNIANIGLILGVSALVMPLGVAKSTLRREYPMLLGVMTLFYLLALDGLISRLDGGLLVGALVLFLLFLIHDARRTTSQRAAEEALNDVIEPEPASMPRKHILMIVFGVVFLALGAQLMVNAATTFAEAFGIPSIVIGLTVVAIGTSLPELAASVVGAMHGEDDLSLGNVIGSNLLNVMFVIGLVSLIRPIVVAPEALNTHFPVMIAFSLLIFPLARSGFRINRIEGSVLLSCFVGYTVYLISTAF